MDQKQKSTPKDVFAHLLMIGTLYASVISFIALLFEYVNALIPDPAFLYGYRSPFNQDSVRWATAVLLIVFPVFLLISWFLSRDLKLSPAKRDLKIRKWLIYFTLFLASVTIIVDLIILVYNFLSGELTTRFLLKTLVVFITASSVLGYFAWELKRQELKSNKPKRFAIISAAVVLASIISGFFIIGSPSYQRNLRFDEIRTSDLQILQNEIMNYWIQKEELPNKLEDLINSISGFVPPSDPESKASYEYNVLNPLTFELCATFKLGKVVGDNYYVSKSLMLEPARPYPFSGPPYYQNQGWDHPEGRTCFPRTIDPEIYKLKERP